MKGQWIAVICLSVLLASNLLMPIKDVYAITTFVDSFPIGGQTSSPTGVAFSNDGLKMFVVGNFLANDNVNEYACTAAFYVSTCAYSGDGERLPINAQDDNPSGLAFSANGMKMFIVAIIGLNINEYACTAAFDVSTCAYSGDGERLPISGQVTNPQGVAFSNDGLTMFVVDGGGNDVNEYACTAAFDVNTCGFTDSFDISEQDTAAQDVAFSTDGLTMFVLGHIGTPNVNEYACTAAFDVNTCGFTDSFSVATEESLPSGLAFSANGLKMFVVGTDGDDVNEYTLEIVFDLFSVLSLVGATLIPIDTTALLVAGFNASSIWMIPAVLGLAGAGIVLFKLKRK